MCKRRLTRWGAQSKIVTDAAGIAGVEKVVLPGVGAFRDAMGTLRDAGLVEPIRAAVAEGKWFLGICLGLQLIFEVSYEDGEHEGLGIVGGKVERFDFGGGVRTDEQTLKIPHMGWNSLHWEGDVPLYRGLEQGVLCLLCAFVSCGADGGVSDSDYDRSRG